MCSFFFFKISLLFSCLTLSTLKETSFTFQVLTCNIHVCDADITALTKIQEMSNFSISSLSRKTLLCVKLCVFHFIAWIGWLRADTSIRKTPMGVIHNFIVRSAFIQIAYVLISHKNLCNSIHCDKNTWNLCGILYQSKPPMCAELPKLYYYLTLAEKKNGKDILVIIDIL